MTRRVQMCGRREATAGGAGFRRTCASAHAWENAAQNEWQNEDPGSWVRFGQFPYFADGRSSGGDKKVHFFLIFYFVIGPRFRRQVWPSTLGRAAIPRFAQLH